MAQKTPAALWEIGKQQLAEPEEDSEHSLSHWPWTVLYIKQVKSSTNHPMAAQCRKTGLLWKWIFSWRYKISRDGFIFLPTFLHEHYETVCLQCWAYLSGDNDGVVSACVCVGNQAIKKLCVWEWETDRGTAEKRLLQAKQIQKLQQQIHSQNEMIKNNRREKVKDRWGAAGDPGKQKLWQQKKMEKRRQEGRREEKRKERKACLTNKLRGAVISSFLLFTSTFEKNLHQKPLASLWQLKHFKTKWIRTDEPAGAVKKHQHKADDSQAARTFLATLKQDRRQAAGAADGTMWPFFSSKTIILD